MTAQPEVLTGRFVCGTCGESPRADGSTVLAGIQRHCLACDRHYSIHDEACPHCGEAARLPRRPPEVM